MISADDIRYGVGLLDSALGDFLEQPHRLMLVGQRCQANLYHQLIDDRVINHAQVEGALSLNGITDIEDSHGAGGVGYQSLVRPAVSDIISRRSLFEVKG